MKNSSKKISIITLNFNKKQYLKPLLDSLFDQTYLDFEIILVDNASNDGSNEFVEKKLSQSNYCKK